MPRFDGETFDAERDGARLTTQLGEVRRYMLAQGSGVWLSLAEISDALGYPEASVSARLRDLRKDKFGGYEVPPRWRGAGTWEYRVERKGALVQGNLFAGCRIR